MRTTVCCRLEGNRSIPRQTRQARETTGRQSFRSRALNSDWHDLAAGRDYIADIDSAYLGVLFVVELLGSDPSRCQMVLHGVGQSKVVVPGGRHIAILDQSVVEMPVEAFLHVSDILDLCDTAHTDLLPLLDVRLGFRHLRGLSTEWLDTTKTACRKTMIEWIRQECCCDPLHSERTVMLQGKLGRPSPRARGSPCRRSPQWACVERRRRQIPRLSARGARNLLFMSSVLCSCLQLVLKSSVWPFALCATYIMLKWHELTITPCLQLVRRRNSCSNV